MKKNLSIIVKPLWMWVIFSLWSYNMVQAQAVNFASAVNYAIGGGATGALGVTVGDFDKDGKADLAIANSFTPTGVNSTIAILRGNGNGTFNSPVNFTAPAPQSIAAGFFNADDRLDIATVNIGNDKLTVFMNTTTGPSISFAAPVNYTAGITGGNRDLVVGNFNGDTYQDIAVTNTNGTNVLVFINNPNNPGTFLAPVAYAVGGYPQSITAGDVNGDGRVDLVTGNTSGFNVSVLINNASNPGTFATAASYSAGVRPFSVQIADLNGDARPEIIVLNGGEASAVLSVLRNSGTGTFGAPTNYATRGSGVARIIAGDFNVDGKMDIASVDGIYKSASIYLGNGNGTLAAFTSFSLGTTGGDAARIAIGNFNGDNKSDLAVTRLAGSTVAVLLNTTIIPTNTITTGSLSASGYCAGASMVVPYTTTGTFGAGNIFKVQLSDPSGTFNNPTTLTTLRTATGSITVGVPAGTTNSSMYRVRVVSSNPVVNGTPNPSNITISSSPVAPITITTNPNPAEVCPNTPVTLTAASTDALTYTWSPAEGLNTTTGATVRATPTTTTTYTVRGTNGICSRTATVTITVYEGCRISYVANEIEAPDNHIAVYPNPVTDRVTIKHETAGQGYIQLRSVQGILLQEVAIEGSETELNVSGLPSSLYAVIVVQGNRRKSKFIRVMH